MVSIIWTNSCKEKWGQLLNFGCQMKPIYILTDLLMNYTSGFGHKIILHSNFQGYSLMCSFIVWCNTRTLFFLKLSMASRLQSHQIDTLSCWKILLHKNSKHFINIDIIWFQHDGLTSRTTWISMASVHQFFWQLYNFKNWWHYMVWCVI